MPLQKTKALVKRIPAAKPHLDLLAAVLTIPVLVTVIILNFSNLTKSKTTATPTPTPIIETQTVIQKVPVAVTAVPSSNTQCTPGIGNLSIDLPKEGDTVNANPICITISYQSNNHCGVVWAYRINGGNWSDYSNNAVCLYNMQPGQVTFDLQAKSLVNSDTQVYERHFTYTPSETPIPSITMTATPTPQK